MSAKCFLNKTPGVWGERVQPAVSSVRIHISFYDTVSKDQLLVEEPSFLFFLSHVCACVHVCMHSPLSATGAGRTLVRHESRLHGELVVCPSASHLPSPATGTSGSS